MLIQCLFNQFLKNSRRSRRATAPVIIEALESRTLLSSTVGFEDVGAVLDAESFFNGPISGGTESMGPFGDTQVTGEFESEGLTFNNTHSIDFGSWSGFAYANTTDATTPGFGNQYSSASGDGAEGTDTYGVAFTTGTNPSTVGRTSSTTNSVFQSVYVNNTTYAALSMESGDMFAKQFGGTTGDDPDFFLLTIEGLDGSGSSIGTVDFYLADYRFTDNTQDYIVKDWTQVDISSLGTATELTFSLTSSDVGDFGMNTPAYVAIDNIEIETPDGVLAWNTETGQLYSGVSNGSNFTETAGPSFLPVSDYELFFGDFNGDGTTDAAARNVNGNLMFSDAGTGVATAWGTTLPAADANWIDTFVGDFNGDSRDDLAGLDSAGRWWVSISNGSTFSTAYWSRINPNNIVNLAPGDFNGDGMTDIVAFREDGSRWVSESTGSLFSNDYYGRVASLTSGNWVNFEVGDFNGDGRDDVMQQQMNGQWWQGTSNNNENGVFATSYAGRWSASFSEYHVADFTGDGLDDLAGFVSNSQWWLFQSQTGSTQKNIEYWNSWSPDTFITTVGDFNGDGLPDIAGYAHAQSRWVAQINTNGDFATGLFGMWNNLNEDPIIGTAMVG